jgi:hypothetical protein
MLSLIKTRSFAILLALPSLIGASPALSENGAGSREYRAERFVRDYFATEAGDNALDNLQQFYGPQTDIEGMELGFNAVFASRKELNTKWPKRKYNIRPGTVYVLCSSDVALCTVEATIDFVFEDWMSRRQGAFEIATGVVFLSDPRFSFLLTHDINVDEDLIRGSGQPAPLTAAPIPAPRAKGKKCMVFNGQQFCQ